jgi:DNA replication protein DnaD
MTDLQILSGGHRATERGAAKWGDLALGGFQVLPDALLVNQVQLGLSATDLVVLVNICSYWWSKDHPPFPRSNTIAERMGLDPRSVQRSISRLRKAGLVSVKLIPRANDKVVRALSLDGLVARLDSYARADPVLSSRIEQYKDFKGSSAAAGTERTTDTPT